MLNRPMRHRLLQRVFWNRPGFALLRLLKRSIRKTEVVLFNRSLHSETNGEHWLIDQLDENPIVLDVGFHEGDFTREVLARRPAARIFAFDPAKSAEIAYRNDFQFDHRVSFSGIALSSQDGRAIFNDYGNMCGSLAPRSDAGALKTSYDVQVRSLDSWCAEHAVNHIGLIKIDAEGFDLPVLRGADQLLSNQQVDLFQFEYADGWIASRHFLRDAVEMVKDKPYDLMKLFNGFLEPANYDNTEERFDLGRMFVGVSKGRHGAIPIKNLNL